MADSMPHSEEFKTLAAIKLPRASRAVAIILFLALIAVVAFLLLVPWVQTTSGYGRVTALNPNDRQQEINALVSGVIDRWYVQDGMRVETGAPIVKIIDNDPLFLDRLRDERSQVEAKLAAARSAQETAEIDQRRMQELFTQGLTSQRNAEQARIRVQTLSASVAEAAAELNRLDTRISRQSVQTVTAPRDGVILSVNGGDSSTYIDAGTPIATFVPDNVKRALEIFINGRDVALVSQGRPVRLQFEGWPAIQFSGWPSRAVGTFGGLVISVDASAQANGLFRILVVEDPNDPNPWPSDDFVRFGAKVRGWVILEEVTVGYELWRQLNSFPPEFPSDQAIQ